MQTIVFIQWLDYTSKLSVFYRGNMIESQANSSSGRGGVIWGRVLSAILLLAILGAIAALIITIASPFKEPFTEFYLLDLKGGTTEYPKELKNQIGNRIRLW